MGTLYLYFKNKDDILIASAESYAQKHITDALEILNSQISPSEKLKAYIINRFRAALDTRQSTSHAAELARAVIGLKPELLEEQTNWMRENLKKIIQSGIDRNLFYIDNIEQNVEVFYILLLSFFLLLLLKGIMNLKRKSCVWLLIGLLSSGLGNGLNGCNGWFM